MGAFAEIGENLWNFGMFLLEDDKHDIGYTTYRGRKSHFYHGEQRPDHPSPFHHWHAAIGLLGTAQVFGYLDMYADLKAAMEEVDKIQSSPPAFQMSSMKPLLSRT